MVTKTHKGKGKFTHTCQQRDDFKRIVLYMHTNSACTQVVRFFGQATCILCVAHVTRPWFKEFSILHDLLRDTSSSPPKIRASEATHYIISLANWFSMSLWFDLSWVAAQRFFQSICHDPIFKWTQQQKLETHFQAISQPHSASCLVNGSCSFEGCRP